MPRKILLLVVAEVLILAFAYLRLSHHIAGAYGFPLDDSWIYAQFARNISQGSGIVYNPGQHVSPTGILYALLLGAMYRIWVAPILDAAVLGLLLHAGAAVLIYCSARQMSLDETAATLCALAFAAIPRLMWAALSGMEIPLYVFLVCLGLYWHMRYRWHDGWKAYLTTLSFALATLARPECGAFLVASVADRLISSRRFDVEKGGVVRYAGTIPLHAAVFGAVLLPAVIFNISATGLPLPPAFYAKTVRMPHASELQVLKAGLSNVIPYLSQAATASIQDNWVLFVGLLCGIVIAFRWSSKAARSGMRMLPMAFVIVPVATALLARKGTGKSQLTFQTGRYSDYLVPMLVLLAVAGVVGFKRMLERRHAGASMTRLVVPLFALAAGAVFVVNHCEMANSYAWQVQNINAMQVMLGKWAARLPEGTVLAVNDAGAIPFFSHKRIIDTVGVVNPEVFPYLRKYRRKEDGLLEYLASLKPDYVVIFPSWYSELAARDDILQPIKSIRLRHNVVCGGREMIVYRPDWKKAASTSGTRDTSLKPGCDMLRGS